MRSTTAKPWPTSASSRYRDPKYLLAGYIRSGARDKILVVGVPAIGVVLRNASPDRALITLKRTIGRMLRECGHKDFALTVTKTGKLARLRQHKGCQVIEIQCDVSGALEDLADNYRRQDVAHLGEGRFEVPIFVKSWVMQILELYATKNECTVTQAARQLLSDRAAVVHPRLLSPEQRRHLKARKAARRTTP